MGKFCGKCGVMTDVDLEKDLENKMQETAVHNQGYPSEHTPKQDKKSLKRIGFAIGAVVFILAIVGVILFSRTNEENGENVDYTSNVDDTSNLENISEELSSQLEELDPTSYSDIKGWVENEFVQYFEHYFSLRVRATDEDKWFISDGFLEDEARFIRWDFSINMHREELLIELTYEELTLAELLQSELEELNKYSLSDILAWVERTEEEHGNKVYSIAIWAENIDGLTIDSAFANMENEAFFEEWNFEIQDGFRLKVRINIVFDTARVFGLGDTFVFDDVEITFHDEAIQWRIVYSVYSHQFGQEYFIMPVTLNNLSDVTISFSSPQVYTPDDTQVFRPFHSTGPEVDIASIRHLPPGETRVYVFVVFHGDGDYRIFFWGWPVSKEVIVPIVSGDFQEERDELQEMLESED